MLTVQYRLQRCLLGLNQVLTLCISVCLAVMSPEIGSILLLASEYLNLSLDNRTKFNDKRTNPVYFKYTCS